MSQRSATNDRYRKDAKVGSTRKSAAKAKPVRKQGSSASSAKATTKPKKQSADKDWSGLPTSPEIKKWRRIWWALLLGGLTLIAVSYLVPELRGNENVLRTISMVVLALSLAAVSIDLVIIRRLRKELIAASAKKPSPKAAKAAAAEKAEPKAEKSGKKSGKEDE